MKPIRLKAARQKQRRKRYVSARRPREQGRCLRGLCESIEHGCASKKRVISSGNRIAENGGVYKGRTGECENRIRKAEPNYLKTMQNGNVVMLLLKRFE